MSIVWLAGYPHCGSTYTRMVLKDVFGINSHSLYTEEELVFLFGEQAATFAKEWDSEKYNELKDSDDLHIIKTHDMPIDCNPTIFVVRDGLEASVALSHFWKIPVKNVISGHGRFGSWSGFYYAWEPIVRPYTLIVKYEELEADANAVAVRLGEFLARKPQKLFENKFEEAKDQFPKLFNDREGCSDCTITADENRLFWRCHGLAMRELGYA